MSFDPVTGFLYVGDVGQDLYEEVDVVTNGANCGWAYYEGLHLAKTLYPGQSTILTNPPPGLTFPIQEIPHGAGDYQGVSVIGGVVYRGSRISQLYGAYVFSDNGSGKVWMLTYNGTNTIPFKLLTTSTGGPAAFGTDPRNGDILLAQVGSSQIGRLDYSGSPTGAPLPPTLANTGAFTNLTTLAPSAGIVPYDLNVPFWSDNAIKSRWFSVPNVSQKIGFNPNGNWSFPTGSVWIKHFELELTNGVAASRKRLETRFIVRNTNGIYGITYRWDSATNATLVPEAGTNESFTINDGGNLRTQVWHYPSRSECLACHTAAGGYALGFRTEQLNRNLTYGSLTTNEISALSAAGYFSAPVTNNPATLLALAPTTDTSASLEFRARSFLAANCAQCHQPGGQAGRANWGRTHHHFHRQRRFDLRHSGEQPWQHQQFYHCTAVADQFRFIDPPCRPRSRCPAIHPDAASGFQLGGCPGHFSRQRLDRNPCRWWERRMCRCSIQSSSPAPICCLAAPMAGRDKITGFSVPPTLPCP